MKLIWILSFLGYLRGFFLYIFNRHHFLFILLRLEFIMLSVFFILVIMLIMGFLNIFLSIIYLRIVVCEGVLGLSIMVLIIRVSGNDLLIRIRVLW